MEQQLRGTAMGGDFERSGAPAEDGAPAAGGSDGGGDEDAPIDLDRNLMQSLLQSYSAQEGLPGPGLDALRQQLQRGQAGQQQGQAAAEPHAACGPHAASSPAGAGAPGSRAGARRAATTQTVARQPGGAKARPWRQPRRRVEPACALRCVGRSGRSEG